MIIFLPKIVYRKFYRKSRNPCNIQTASLRYAIHRCCIKKLNCYSIGIYPIKVYSPLSQNAICDFWRRWWIFSRGLSNSNGLRMLIFPQPLGRALKNQNAAPTTPPCFCHRQRSSSLHWADCLRSADRRPVLILTILAAKKAPA